MSGLHGHWANLVHAAAASLLLVCMPALADPRVAILDFELNDLTPLPIVPEELERTASVAPLVREALAQARGWQVVAVDPALQSEANVASGYLFDHPQFAAALGARLGAEWVAVGLLHKPSFLFAYLKVRLVEVETRRIAGDYIVEVKGAMRPTTERGAAQLAEKIAETIDDKRWQSADPDAQ
jgi:hypothetical protein